ncbi:hypothetical protein SAMN05216228_100853 [Rhizobium tibeticum]|uniref:Uncharacterized protein n=1 Tax=Rhizobium tibeticum TaxID=501024 RepID=A0A1H8JTU6_9HYPH|nr:hypothetical protein [Rhizobium tibeticum]SEH79478.1 hypothetical protein RTCCBAU85039_2405 [Rhizobium tibeticum]SEN83991.1 hypothetical protein SAMN05216228_100853 [Rhizobium tibeticum]
MTDKRNVADIQRDLLTRIHTEGVQAAYEASLAVARDPKAPAPARATASATLFRVAGYFDRQERDQAKEPHEMTASELHDEIARLARRSQDKGADEDVFG